jgi:hypothetical protein
MRLVLFYSDGKVMFPCEIIYGCVLEYGVFCSCLCCMPFACMLPVLPTVCASVLASIRYYSYFV